MRFSEHDDLDPRWDRDPTWKTVAETKGGRDQIEPRAADCRGAVMGGWTKASDHA